MKLIDTHAHLDMVSESIGEDEMLESAREADVERIVTIGASSGLESNRAALEFAREYDWIKCTAGVHPHKASLGDEEHLQTIRDEFSEELEVVAIGETGLDYYYENSPKEVQRRVFRQMLELSKDVDKPVVIHTREAEEDTVEILEDSGVTDGIIHCFSGSEDLAEKALDLGFHISFSGLVTFVDPLLQIAEKIPLDRILFETDAPFLAPEPNRGKTNQPAYVRHTAQKIADARDIPLEELAAAVWDNASRLFDW